MKVILITYTGIDHSKRYKIHGIFFAFVLNFRLKISSMVYFPTAFSISYIFLCFKKWQEICIKSRYPDFKRFYAYLTGAPGWRNSQLLWWGVWCTRPWDVFDRWTCSWVCPKKCCRLRSRSRWRLLFKWRGKSKWMMKKYLSLIEKYIY